jgi:hypothetical protein
MNGTMKFFAGAGVAGIVAAVIAAGVFHYPHKEPKALIPEPVHKRILPVDGIDSKKAVRNVSAKQVPVTGVTDVKAEASAGESLDAIKQTIYADSIEYTDDIGLLDDMVQPSAARPETLWNGSWVSSDDWKRYDDTFKIDTDSQGNYRLSSGSDGSKAYVYDPKRKEFVWTMDYYGKTITSRAKFLTGDVMVLMKISGEKVALDIYRRDVKPAGNTQASAD